MIAKYKTTDKHTFQLKTERKPRVDHIYIEVRFPEFENNSVKPQGIYYVYIEEEKEVTQEDENGEEITTTETYSTRVVLDTFRGEIPFQQVDYIDENTLPPFSQNKKTIPALKERIKQFTLIKIDEEYQEDNTSNWGINSSILEEITV